MTVVATSYLLAVSTRRMEQLVETLGNLRLSKSQVSEMARDLDAQVEAFRTRPLDAGLMTVCSPRWLAVGIPQLGILTSQVQARTGKAAAEARWVRQAGRVASS